MDGGPTETVSPFNNDVTSWWRSVGVRYLLQNCTLNHNKKQTLLTGPKTLSPDCAETRCMGWKLMVGTYLHAWMFVCEGGIVIEKLNQYELHDRQTFNPHFGWCKRDECMWSWRLEVWTKLVRNRWNRLGPNKVLKSVSITRQRELIPSIYLAETRVHWNLFLRSFFSIQFISLCALQKYKKKHSVSVFFIHT